MGRNNATPLGTAAGRDGRSVGATMHIDIGVDIVDLSILNLPAVWPQGTSDKRLEELETHYVVCLLCADGSVRAIALPQARPNGPCNVDLSSADKDHGVTSLVLSSLAISSGSRPGKISVSVAHAHSVNDEEPGIYLIVACHASIPSSRLVAMQIPLGKLVEGKYNEQEHLQSSTVFLPHPLAKLSLALGQSSSLETLSLLLADTSGALRAAVLYPMGPVSETLRVQWLGTCLVPPGPARGSHSSRLSPQHRIVDATWVLDSKAVVAVLSDGQWGFWDLHNQARNTPRNEMVMCGRLGSFPDASTAIERNGSKTKTVGSVVDSNKLAPMTPRTRKARQDAPFENHKKSSASSTQPSAIDLGGLEAVNSGRAGSPTNDCLLLWYNNAVYAVPDVKQLLQETHLAARRGTSSHSPETDSIYHVPLSSGVLGEGISKLSALSGVKQPSTSSSTPSLNLAVLMGHRLTLANFEEPAPTSRNSKRKGDQLAADPKARRDRARNDASMLRRGELDIGGMNRLLDEMNGHDATLTSRPRKVGFTS